MSAALVHSPKHRLVISLAVAVCATLWALTLATGCGRPAETPKAAAAPSYTVRGEARLQDAASSLGTAIFCAGTSYIAYTDADGHYAISAVPPGIYTVVARHDGFRMLELGRVELPAQPSSGPSAVTLPSAVLQREEPTQAAAAPQETPEPAPATAPVGGLTGVVHLAGGASPLPVALHLDQGVVAGSPDATGRFTLSNLAAGLHTLHFDCEGYTPSAYMVTVVPNRVVELPVTVELAQVELPVEEHPGILGTVLTVRGDGTARDTAPDATVLVIENQRTTRVAADGSFAFDDLPAGHYTLAVQAPGYLARRRETVDVKNAPATVVLVLEEGKATIVGTIVLKNPARQDRPAGSLAALTGTDRSGVTDAAGHFTLTDVPSGGYTLFCSRTGYKSVEAADLQVPPGIRLDVGTVTLERDVEAPRLIATAPADGARDVVIEPLNVATLTFSRRMDLATVRAGLTIDPPCEFAVQRPAGAQPDSAAASDTFEVRIPNGRRSAAPMTFKTRYTVTLADSVADSDGTALEGPHGFSFQTGGLAVLHTYPAPGARGVSTQSGAELTFYFNGVVDLPTLDARSIDVSPIPASLAPSGHAGADPATGWTIYRLPMTMRYATTYDVRLAGGIRTVEGVTLSPSPVRFSFQTETEPQLPNQ